MAIESQRAPFSAWLSDLQDRICGALEAADGAARFQEDHWERPGGGGGRSRVIQDGAVFEKGGVNISAVYGELPPAMRAHFKVEEAGFFATGLSLVIHPRSPMVPTVHANYRYFELYGDPEEGERGGAPVDAWFGGGADLTPYYLFDEDAAHFHATQKAALHPHGVQHYPALKAACDAYFFNHHRGESRGIGGIFFDYVRAEKGRPLGDVRAFTQAAGEAFIPAYLPIVERRKGLPYTEEERYFQELRRGRYVEFNLIHDRGTLFGLKTGGRIESILMSLPPRVRWDYDPQVTPGSREAQLIEVLRSPRDWA